MQRNFRDYYGSWWVGPGVTRNCLCVCEKSSHNTSNPVQIMNSVCRYTLLKVVSYYDLIVQSMSVMGFQIFF